MQGTQCALERLLGEIVGISGSTEESAQSPDVGVGLDKQVIQGSAITGLGPKS